MYFDLDREMLFYFLFAFLQYAMFARCQHYNSDDFSDEPDFNTVHRFNIAN